MTPRGHKWSSCCPINYGKEGYFFGYDSNIVRLFKANDPDGVGKSFKDNRDPNGVYVNRGLVQVAKDGHSLSRIQLAAARQPKSAGA
jgi:signal transduction histidine kinase